MRGTRSPIFQRALATQAHHPHKRQTIKQRRKMGDRLTLACGDQGKSQCQRKDDDVPIAPNLPAGGRGHGTRVLNRRQRDPGSTWLFECSLASFLSPSGSLSYRKPLASMVHPSHCRDSKLASALLASFCSRDACSFSSRSAKNLRVYSLGCQITKSIPAYGRFRDGERMLRVGSGARIVSRFRKSLRT